MFFWVTQRASYNLVQAFCHKGHVTQTLSMQYRAGWKVLKGYNSNGAKQCHTKKESLVGGFQNHTLRLERSVSGYTVTLSRWQDARLCPVQPNSPIRKWLKGNLENWLHVHGLPKAGSKEQLVQRIEEYYNRQDRPPLLLKDMGLDEADAARLSVALYAMLA